MPSVHADTPDRVIAADIAAFIRSDDFPCVGAKSALRLGQIEVCEDAAFEQPAQYSIVRDRLVSLGSRLQAAGASEPLTSCLWAFASGGVQSEAAYERQMWTHLQKLHDLDAEAGCAWSPAVSCDTNSAEFSMSVGGHAYFVVGMHPGASRAARRFSRPMLAFNAHIQFERLRADGRYDVMRDIIRRRDRAAHGDINPMLGHHGERAQAPQFSGRIVPRDWQCPFKVRTR